MDLDKLLQIRQDKQQKGARDRLEQSMQNPIKQGDGVSMGVAQATDPDLAAAHAIAFLQCGDAGLDHIMSETLALTDVLKGHREQIAGGDLSQVEAVLSAQVQVLQAAFVRFMFLSAVAKTDAGAQRFTDIALRCQNQCRKAIVTLNEMKNPKRSTTFIRNQQNVLSLEDAKQAKSLEQSDTEEFSAHAQMDARSQRETTTGSAEIATVEAQHRTTNTGGEGQV